MTTIAEGVMEAVGATGGFAVIAFIVKEFVSALWVEQDVTRIERVRQRASMLERGEG